MNNLNSNYKIIEDQVYQEYEDIVIPRTAKNNKILNFIEELENNN